MSVYDFAEELKSSKKELINMIEKIWTVDSSVIRRTGYALLPIRGLGNPRLEKESGIALNELKPKEFFFIKKYPSVKKYQAVLSNLIIQIDKEIDYEEKVGAIAEKLSQVHVSLSDGETAPELERKIRQNAIAISRIIS